MGLFFFLLRVSAIIIRNDIIQIIVKGGKNKMLAKQRYSKILELLERDGIVNTAELVSLMNVSSETIRKDLKHLDKQGQLSRVHGGAVPVSQIPSAASPTGYITFQKRNSQHLEQKAAITKKAIELITEGQVVALDFGSTSQTMALALKEHFHRLTVITCSIQNALLLAENPGLTIILTGGVLNRDEYTLVNDFSSILDNLHIDIMFMSVTGIDPMIGCTDQRVSETRIQNQLRHSASKTVVLADSSKFGKASLVKICTLNEVDTIITDSGISADMEKQIRALGTELIIA